MNPVKIHYDKYTWLPEAVIQSAIDQKWEISLAYFIILRQFYNNNTFYNFTYRSISEKTGISSAVLYRHIKRLKEKGLIRVHKNNLTLVGTKKLKEIHGKHIVAIKQAPNKKSTILNIQFTRVLANLKTQSYIVNKRKEVKKLQESGFLSPKKVKSLLKARKKLNNEISANDYYMMSNAKFGSLNNRSKATGLKIQKRMNNEGLITSTKNVEKISSKKYNLRSFYAMNLPCNYRLSNKGYIFKIMPNRISLPNAIVQLTK